MSKFVLLSEAETAVAASRGWLLADVYDLKQKIVRPQILPTKFTPPERNTESTFRRVFVEARNGDAVALRALQLLNQEFNRETRHRRPK